VGKVKILPRQQKKMNQTFISYLLSPFLICTADVTEAVIHSSNP
jgi:hypothetical protein